MINLIAGQKSKVAELISGTILPIAVNIAMPQCETDISCFGVDKEGKLSDESYFIFYNQLSSPEGAIKKEANADHFTINLSALPSKIEKLVITATIDGSDTMNALKDSSVIFGENSASYNFNGSQFRSEKAIIVTEIYRYNGEWRIAIVGKGFDGGLSALLAHFGGEEIKEAPSTTPAPVSLKKSDEVNKIVFEKAPHLVDLTKKAIVSLEKQNLSEIRANVVLVLDASGSMDGQYKKGRVQRILDKVLPLALLFDDNGSLESWGFAMSYRQLPNATIENCQDYIIKADGGWKKWKIGKSNNEPAVMNALLLKHKDSKLPVYVLFISDGGVGQNSKIKEIMITSSYKPIFWQFIGINGNNYGVLEELDEMWGRHVDNANFFALDDIDSISDEALYDRLMSEFPLWLKAIKQKRMI